MKYFWTSCYMKCPFPLSHLSGVFCDLQTKTSQMMESVLVCWAIVANYHKLSWLKHPKLIVKQFWRLDHSSRSPRSRCWQGTFLLRLWRKDLFQTSPLDFQMAVFSLCLSTSSPLYVYLSLCQISPFSKNTSHTGLGLTLMASL